MNIIIVSRRHGKARTLSLGNRLIVLAALCFCTFTIISFVVGYQYAVDKSQISLQNQYINSWLADLSYKDGQLKQLEKESSEQFESLTIRLAKLHAKLIRLDALGEHLAEAANLEQGEFDFSKSPAIGGPAGDFEGIAYQPPKFMEEISRLAQEIEAREQELEFLNMLLGNSAFEIERYISGRPVKWGWISSSFGRRVDPFNGRIAWHEGVDFAGKENSDVIAVAAGVVTWAGPRQGYGNLVEIDHGDRHSTRYAHANKLLVGVGDVIEKGQSIALMGSSGRSTGPHVHYEVLKNGHAVDPAIYIKRKSR